MEHNKTTITERILGKIESGGLSMRPKYYFYLRIGAIIAVATAMFIVSIFIFNFIFFSIRINSEDTFLFMGPRGWRAFLFFFPWHLLILDTVLMMALLWLMRQFRFGYQNPLLFLALGLILLTTSAALLIDRTTGLNEHFLREANERRLPPPFGEFYRGVRHEHPGFPAPQNPGL